MSSTNNTATKPFPNLAVELRHKIYRYALHPEFSSFEPQPLAFVAGESGISDNPRYLQWLNHLARANEAARVDVSLYLIREIEFYILYPDQATKFEMFLRSLGEGKGFPEIRHLDFQLFGRHQPSAGVGNTFIELMKKCPELRKVKIKFEVRYMVVDSCNWKEDPVMLPKSLRTFDSTQLRELDDVVSAYRMMEFFQLQNLARLIVEVWPRVRVSDRHCMHDVLVDCTPLMERLVAWLQDGFRARGRDVDVSLVEASSPGLRWTRRG